jgi:hypothetical protein
MRRAGKGTRIQVKLSKEGNICIQTRFKDWEQLHSNQVQRLETSAFKLSSKTGNICIQTKFKDWEYLSNKEEAVGRETNHPLFASAWEPSNLLHSAYRSIRAV